MTTPFALALVLAAAVEPAPRPTPRPWPTPGDVRLADVQMRDACILADEASRSYVIVASARRAVRAFTSKDLRTWHGPHKVWEIPDGFWGGADVAGIWAPELHAYKGKYYLFLTIDTREAFAEQWRDWRPRVKRGSQILVSDSPLGPFRPFEDRSTPPPDMMTLDGTLWVEDGVPYMVYCHEWVQIVNGTIERIALTDDLSRTVGDPIRMFWGSDAPWARPSPQYGCWVTDGPYLYRSKSGKLFMPWSSFSHTGYTVGLAVSDSGRLAGPWVQQKEPIFREDGGHSMLFKTFAGQLMMALHSPNEGPGQRIRLFEMEDTGDTLRIVQPFDPDKP